MQLAGRHVVVTGAANGIGEALARRFHRAGARVVIADLDAAKATTVADELSAAGPVASAIGVGVDVGTKAGNQALIAGATERFGPIDLFFANAGVTAGRTPLSPETDWDLAFTVNFHAHRWAVRHLLPGWLARGEGYFCCTASAAGLLTQVDSAAYAVTKHAAVGFAEWLSITYGDLGIRVSCLCPQGVNTALLRAGDDPSTGFASAVVRAAGAVLEPDDVAEVALAGIEEDRFLLLPHPEVRDFAMRRAEDHDRWISGMRRLQARVGDQQPSP